MELNQKTLKKAYNYLSKDPCLDHLINKYSDNLYYNKGVCKINLDYQGKLSMLAQC